MTTLVTGGTGKTGLFLSKFLHQAGQSVLITSRSGKAPEPFKAVEFDWLNSLTFRNPFDADENIKRVYLVAPNHVYNPLPYMKPFIDLAVSAGVTRFVLLTGSQWNISELPLGTVHQYLLHLNLDYVVIKPTWFIENFATLFYTSIRERNEIFSSAGDGKIPFVSAEDIAQASFDALTADKCTKREYFLVGPDLFTYSEVAALLSEVLERRITYRRNTVEEQTQVYATVMPLDYARKLANTEILASLGEEEKIFKKGADEVIIGKHSLKEFIQNNKSVWIK